MIQSASWRSNLLGSRPPTTDENVDSLKIMMALWYSMANESLEDTFRPNIGLYDCMSKFSLPGLVLEGLFKQNGCETDGAHSISFPNLSKASKKNLLDPIPEGTSSFFWCLSATLHVQNPAGTSV